MKTIGIALGWRERRTAKVVRENNKTLAKTVLRNGMKLSINIAPEHLWESNITLNG